MKITIVPMDRGHVKEIARLERVCFSEPWSELALEETLYNSQASFLVAENEEQQVLGYAGLYVVLDEGYIANIAVAPEHRGTGVAKALMDVFCSFAQEHLAFMTLEVRVSNEAAIGLYRSFGFQDAGLRKNYYTNPKEDGLLMTRWFREKPQDLDQ